MKIQNLSFTTCLNRHAQPGFVAVPVERALDGVQFSAALRQAAPEQQRVTSPARLNPASDALLLNLIDKLPRSLASMTWQAMKRWVTRGDADPLQTSPGFQAGQQAPLDLEALTDTLHSIAQEFPFRPHIGAEHVWSRDARGYQGPGFWKRVGGWMRGERPFPFPTFARSKLLCALGLGATSLVMPTGKEEPLRAWILQQKPASIELHQLFREAYRLNEGDLYGTLLCAENVLSEGLYDPDRQQREVTSRLSYLRSDSAPEGDNFGAWYHLFGAALYSLMRPEWKAALSLKVEDLGSLILEGKDPQEDHVNQLGMKLGQALKRLAQDGAKPGAEPRPYVNLREFPWDRRSLRYSSS